MEYNLKYMGHSKSTPKRKIHNIADLPQEKRKISNKQSKLKPKRTKKKQQSPEWVEGRKLYRLEWK